MDGGLLVVGSELPPPYPGAGSGTANPLSGRGLERRSRSFVNVVGAPDLADTTRLTNIEDRGISAAFLRHFTATKLTSSHAKEATTNAIVYLNWKVDDIVEKVRHARPNARLARRPAADCKINAQHAAF